MQARGHGLRMSASSAVLERLTVCVQPKRASPSSVTAWSLQVARPVPINSRHRLPATFMDNRHVERVARFDPATGFGELVRKLVSR